MPSLSYSALESEILERIAQPASLLSQEAFNTLALGIFLAGATEIAVAQRISAYAEKGLGLPKLLGDIGGTNARFAIETAPFEFSDIQTLTCRDYPTLASAITAYLTGTNHPEVRHAALAVPSCACAMAADTARQLDD